MTGELLVLEHGQVEFLVCNINETKEAITGRYQFRRKEEKEWSRDSYGGYFLKKQYKCITRTYQES